MIVRAPQNRSPLGLYPYPGGEAAMLPPAPTTGALASPWLLAAVGAGVLAMLLLGFGGGGK